MTDPVEIDIEKDVEENPEIYVADPDEYLKTQRLKLINRAKTEVHKIREDPHQYRKIADEIVHWDWHDVYRKRLAEAVAHYGNELVPLIEKGIQRGALPESVFQLTPSNPETVDEPSYDSYNLQVFISADGALPADGELTVPDVPTIMLFYRELQSIEQRLGLGLEIEEDHGPAEI